MPDETIPIEDYDSGAGGPVDRCSLTLRFFGDDLDPDCVTALLDVEPTQSRRKDDGTRRMINTGCWILSCEETTDSPDHQIQRLLNDLTQDLSIWQQLANNFSASLMVDLIPRRWARGTTFTAETIQALSDRNLKLQLEIYAPRYSHLV